MLFIEAVLKLERSITDLRFKDESTTLRREPNPLLFRCIAQFPKMQGDTFSETASSTFDAHEPIDCQPLGKDIAKILKNFLKPDGKHHVKMLDSTSLPIKTAIKNKRISSTIYDTAFSEILTQMVDMYSKHYINRYGDVEEEARQVDEEKSSEQSVELEVVASELANPACESFILAICQNDQEFAAYCDKYNYKPLNEFIQSCLALESVGLKIECKSNIPSLIRFNDLHTENPTTPTSQINTIPASLYPAYTSLYENYILANPSFPIEVDSSIVKRMGTTMKLSVINGLQELIACELESMSVSEEPVSTPVDDQGMSDHVFEGMVDAKLSLLFSDAFSPFYAQSHPVTETCLQPLPSLGKSLEVQFVDAILDYKLKQMCHTATSKEDFAFIIKLVALEREIGNQTNTDKTYTPSLQRFITSANKELQIHTTHDTLSNIHESRLISLFAFSFPFDLVPILRSVYSDPTQHLTSFSFDELIQSALQRLFTSSFLPTLQKASLKQRPSFAASAISDTFTPSTSRAQGAFHTKRQSLSFSTDTRKCLEDNGKAAFIKCLNDPTIYELFRLSCEDDHCLENIEFYENYLELERARNGAIAYVNVCDRFLTNERNANGEGFVPVEIVSTYYAFKSTFVESSSNLEVNISDKRKKLICSDMTAGSACVPFNVYDEAADEVLILLYLNSFKNFAKRAA